LNKYAKGGLAGHLHYKRCLTPMQRGVCASFEAYEPAEPTIGLCVPAARL